MKVDTVNVVEYADDDLLGIRSYSDDDEGNHEAEECFRAAAKEHGAHDNELAVFVEDGYYESGTYQLFLTHSTV